MNKNFGIGIGSIITGVGITLIAFSYINDTSANIGILTTFFGIAFIIKVLGK